MPEDKFAAVEPHATVDLGLERLLERLDKMEATLLKEFRNWGLSYRSRFRANEVLTSGFSERLMALEERVSDLERGKD